jgi:hypothetical protein
MLQLGPLISVQKYSRKPENFPIQFLRYYEHEDIYYISFLYP